MNSRTKLGLSLSIIWLGLVGIYLFFLVDPKVLVSMRANEIGDFLAGTFAPLAFSWLVLGYYQQGDELKLQRKELELQREQLKAQTDETAKLAAEAKRQASILDATHDATRQDLFIKMYLQTERELVGLALQIGESIRLDGNIFEIAKQRPVPEHYQVFASLRYGIETLIFNSDAVQTEQQFAIWSANAGPTPHLRDYAVHFENLVTFAREIPSRDHIERMLRRSTMGVLCVRINALLMAMEKVGNGKKLADLRKEGFFRGAFDDSVPRSFWDKAQPT